jgi:thymidylate synthase
MVADMCMNVVTLGRPRGARGKGSRDLNGFTGVLLDPRARIVHNPAREIRPGYPEAWVAWNLGKRRDVESICWWNPNGRKISDDGLTFHGANYGQRHMGQLWEAIHLLKEDPDTRRAFCGIWHQSDLVRVNPGFEGTSFYSREGKDVPCTIGFGLSIADDLLHMEVIMRSQSAWAVFPYDLYYFTVLQELIANEMELGLGYTTWHCISLHVYDSEIPWLANGLDAYETQTWDRSPMPRIPATLGEAQVSYPAAMDGFSADHTFTPQGLTSDPILVRMAKGSRVIHDSLAYLSP